MNTEDFKLWPAELPTVLSWKCKASRIEFNDNSVLFGYTIGIPKKVYDNALKCSRSYKVINTHKQKNMYGELFRRSYTKRCYFIATARIPFAKLDTGFYTVAQETLNHLKQLAMIKARELKELYFDSERQSLEKGEMTNEQVKQLNLNFAESSGVDPKELPF